MYAIFPMKLKLFIFLFFLFAIVHIKASVNDKYLINNITSTNGLSNSAVLTIFQDSDFGVKMYHKLKLFLLHTALRYTKKTSRQVLTRDYSPLKI